jgi:hypothetical protein
VPSPLRSFSGYAIARTQQHTAWDRHAVAAQQGFSVDLRQAHNAAPPVAPIGA